MHASFPHQPYPYPRATTYRRLKVQLLRGSTPHRQPFRMFAPGNTLCETEEDSLMRITLGAFAKFLFLASLVLPIPLT